MGGNEAPYQTSGRPSAVNIAPLSPPPAQTVHATLDGQGRPVRFYADHAAVGPLAISGEAPAEAIELTMVQFFDCLANPGRRRWMAGPASGGDLVACDVPELPVSSASRMALGSALRDALKYLGVDEVWATALAAQSQDTRDWWASGYRDMIPENAPKLVRIAAACKPKVKPKALFDAALSGGSTAA